MSNVTIEEIRGLPAELLALRDTTKIAEALPFRVSVQTKLIGVGSILAVMAPYGGDFLNTLEAMGAIDGNVRWVLKLIEKGELDIGLDVTRLHFIQFSQANPTLATPINSLLGLAEVAVPVTEMDVRKLVWSNDGEWQV